MTIVISTPSKGFPQMLDKDMYQPLNERFIVSVAMGVFQLLPQFRIPEQKEQVCLYIYGVSYESPSSDFNFILDYDMPQPGVSEHPFPFRFVRLRIFPRFSAA